MKRLEQCPFSKFELGADSWLAGPLGVLSFLFSILVSRTVATVREVARSIHRCSFQELEDTLLIFNDQNSRESTLNPFFAGTMSAVCFLDPLIRIWMIPALL